MNAVQKNNKYRWDSWGLISPRSTSLKLKYNENDQRTTSRWNIRVKTRR